MVLKGERFEFLKLEDPWQYVNFQSFIKILTCPISSENSDEVLFSDGIIIMIKKMEV